LRRAFFLILVVLILIGSGFLTTQLSRQTGGGALPGVRVQTDNPAGNVLVTTPEKGTLFFLFAGFVITNLVGIGATLALIFWFLNRSINKAKARANNEFSFSLSASRPNSLGGALARRPAITIGLLLFLAVGAALTAALLGFFTPR